MRDPNPEGGPAARPAKEDQPAIAEQTAGVGSVTVRKTERGAARKLWLPLWHWQPAGRPWRYWAIHLSIAILGAAAPIYVTARLIGFLGVRPSDEVLNSIVGGQDAVPIVVSNFRNPIIDTRYGRVQVPPNVPLVGVADALGISELREAISQGRPRRAPGLYMTGEYGQEQRQVNFFTVGGPTVNDMTRDLVAVWDDSKTSVEQAYHFEKGNTLDGKLVIHYPAHYVEDFGQSNGEVPGPKVYKPKTDETGRILNDFGFIIIGPNPYDHTKMVCALYGVWPQGTQAAVRALVRPDAANPLFQDLLRRVRSREGVVAIVETKVFALTAESPSLVFIRSLDPTAVPLKDLKARSAPQP